MFGYVLARGRVHEEDKMKYNKEDWYKYNKSTINDKGIVTM